MMLLFSVCINFHFQFHIWDTVVVLCWHLSNLLWINSYKINCSDQCYCWFHTDILKLSYSLCCLCSCFFSFQQSHCFRHYSLMFFFFVTSISNFTMLRLVFNLHMLHWHGVLINKKKHKAAESIRTFVCCAFSGYVSITGKFDFIVFSIVARGDTA